MKLTKRELTYIQGYFGTLKDIMKRPETRSNLIKYGIFAGRFAEIMWRRIDVDKLEETEEYIKKTLGEEFYNWYMAGHEEFLMKGE
jgi:hypothetical protein